MNKKLEEQLAKMAFGDMSPEETARLEQIVAGDREATRVLNEYRDMRTDLLAMSQVPEHQLSTDRLRHAILNQGLKPASRPQFGWLWIPTMAATLAFGIMFLRNARHSPLEQIAGAGSPVASLESTGGMPELDRAPRLQNAFAFADASAQILSVAPIEPTVVAHPRRRMSADRLAALRDAVNQEFENNLIVNASGGVVANQPESRSQPSGAPIVLIDTTKDSATGAQKATEVDSGSNVVVGG